MLSWLMLPGVAVAQIFPDNSLPVRSEVPADCSDCDITGGTRSGSNLFHSFEQFSIPGGRSAHFQNASDIQTIFTRVTGQNRSIIDGILRANGNADLFLLNPNGIIFGKNAALDIGGSFFATTADSIDFADGFRFSATEGQDSSLLTVSTPIGLQFGETSGSIVNRSQASPEGRLNTLRAPVGLEVQPGHSLTLLGNGVFLENGNLTARGGQITLGSVSPSSFVSLNSVDLGYGIAYSADQVFRDIRIVDNSYLDTSDVIGGQAGGGAIRLQGRDIDLIRSTVTSSNFGGTGGLLKLIASGSLRLINGSSIGSFAEGTGQAGRLVMQANRSIKLRGDNPSVIGAQARHTATATGSAGDVFIRTDQLLLTEGSRIEASSFGAGQAGDIRIRVLDLRIAGPSPLLRDGNHDGTAVPGEVSSGIFAQVQVQDPKESVQSGNTGDLTFAQVQVQDPEESIQSGNAGDLTIRTRRLTLSDGGVISVATFASGNGGTLTIQATDSIVLRGASPAVTRDQYRSGIFVSAEPMATGKVGALMITAPRLVVDDRAEISANNRGAGEPGRARLRVDELEVRGGGEIRASALGSGQGGTLRVRADSIELVGSGRIGSEIVPSSLAAIAQSSGDAGDLDITTTSLTIRDGAEISVSGGGLGSAGTLDVSAEQITLDQGRIAASTENGSGAEITLDGLDVLLMRNDSAITTTAGAASGSGDGGDINIDAVFIIATPFENNDVSANAFSGAGGKVEITSQRIFGLAPLSREELETRLEGSTAQALDPKQLSSSDITAISQQNPRLNGQVILITPDVDPTQGGVELPTDIIDASQLVAQGCATGDIYSTTKPGEFVITGRGGLASNPDELGNGAVPSSGWIELPSYADSSVTTASPESLDLEQSQRLVEAQGWLRDANGDVVLVARASESVLQPRSAELSCALNRGEQ